MIKCYKSKIYQGENFDYQVSSYYGGESYPIDGLFVIDEFSKGNRLFCRSAENKVYTNKASALKRARWLAKNT